MKDNANALSEVVCDTYSAAVPRCQGGEGVFFLSYSPLAPSGGDGAGGEGAILRSGAKFRNNISCVCTRWCAFLSLFLFTAPSFASSLPADYFPLLAAGASKVEERLNAHPGADLATLESEQEWRHFPYAILAPAVLYAKKHPGNLHFHDPKMLALALRIGDLLATESEKGTYEPRLDSDWDTGLWMEAYRLLERELGEQRRLRWKREIKKNVELLVPEAKERVDFPWYNSPYIGTSPNHYALWASLLHLAGQLFGDKEWENLGAQILRRFALVEQTSDGYWGEHSRSGPTTGYNHLTFTALSTYYENSKDADVLPALRNTTDFHKFYTYPDGTPVEVINDRNRHWEVNPWGHFGFSHFPDGRRLAEFLTGFFRPESLSVSALGRLAQDALYFHEGPGEAIPQDKLHYSHQMSIPAGIRKTGPWVVSLSGLISTQAVTSQFYLDRQGSLSVFHKKSGLVITGANSKRQPELATFWERIQGQVFHMPLSSRLQMSEEKDRLSLAYNSFFSDLEILSPSDKQLAFRFVINGKGSPAEAARLNLQLRLRPGQTLETETGKLILGTDAIELGPEKLGSWIRHHGWTLKVDPTARLIWPVYPFNPYANGPESKLERAVGVLSVPLQQKERPGSYIRSGEQVIAFVLEVE